MGFPPGDRFQTPLRALPELGERTLALRCCKTRESWIFLLTRAVGNRLIHKVLLDLISYALTRDDARTPTRSRSFMHSSFLFSTGIENSYPVLPNGRRIDQMEKCGHYDRWREDFELVQEMGIPALRYGPPYYRVHAAPDRFDWGWADEQMHALRDRGIEVIADLCHFGVPDWLGGFQDPAFPVLFASYARAF